MRSQILTLRTTLYPFLVRQTLFKGFCISLIGMTLLVYSGTFIPSHLLKFMGLPVFIMGIGCLAWGLLPYRRLSRLELQPDKLEALEAKSIDFFSKGEKVLSLPFNAIQSFDYFQKEGIYGLVILLKTPSHKLRIPSSIFLKEADKRLLNTLQADFFFPYFSQHSVRELKDWYAVADEE